MPYRTSARTDVCPACQQITHQRCSNCDGPLCLHHVWLQCSEACVLNRLRVRKRYRHASDATGDVLRPKVGHAAYRQAHGYDDDPQPGLMDWLALVFFVLCGVVLLSLLIVNCSM